MDPGTSPTLIGRESPLTTLRDALERARAEGGAAVVVAGEAGIGKSALLAAFAHEARAAGAVVLRGATASMDRAVPYAPIAQALRGLLKPLSEAQRRDLVGGARPEIARLLPNLGIAAGGTDDDDVTDPRLRLHSAVMDVLERAADPAVVVEVEDVHWADPSTVDLISSIIADLGTAPILLVLSFRTDELRPSHPIRATLAEWERRPRVHRVDLRPLDDVDLHGVIAPVVDGDEGLAQQVIQRAGGNPFVALELATTGREGAVPTSLSEAILARLGQLSVTAQDLVRAAAAGGLFVSHDLLSCVVDLRPSELRPALREAVDGHFLVADGSGYRFRHALMREVLHDDLLPGERRDAHRSYAKALREVPALQPQGRWSALAEHLDAANDLDGAFHASLQAAEESSQASAFADATEHLARAADLWDDVPSAAAEAGVGKGRLLLRAAKAARLAAEPSRSLGLAERALRQLQADGDMRGAAMAMRWKGAALYDLGRPGFEEAYREGLAMLPADADTERAELTLNLGRALALTGRFAEAEPLLRQTLTLAETTGDDSMVIRAKQGLAGVLGSLGDLTEGEALYRQIVEVEECCTPTESCIVHTNYSDLVELAGRFEDALALCERALSIVPADLPAAKNGWLHLNAAQFAWKLGRLDEVREHLRASPRPADGLSRLHRVLSVARLRLERDAPGSADSALATAARLGSEPHVGPQFSAVVAAVRSRGALLHGDDEAAWELAVNGLRVGAEASGLHRYTGELLYLAIRAAVARQRPDDVAWAVAELDRMQADGRGVAAEWAAWATMGRAEASRVQAGRVALGDLAAWGRAHGAAVALGHRPMTWMAAHRYGEALLDAGRSDEAAAVILPALQEAERAGAAIASVLRGLARRGRLVEGDEGELDLTPRETEVLLLLAEGRTNREIGEALFITDKTASTHVSNLLRKLGVSNRGEAAALAHRHGLVAS